MASDFRAERTRTNSIISSGSSPTTKPLFSLYHSTSATNFTGGTATGLFDGVGTDVYSFFSGSKDHKNVLGSRGVTLFGGDVVISGTLYADKQVIEIDETVTGSLTVSGSLVVSQSIEAGQHLHINSSGGPFGYANFGSVALASGYGFRAAGGTMQFKNTGGAWTAIGTGTGGSSLWMTGSAGAVTGGGTLLNWVSTTGSIAVSGSYLDLHGYIREIGYQTTNYHRFNNNGQSFNAEGVSMMELSSLSGQKLILINAANANVDFRVDSANRDKAFYVDADLDRVSILSGALNTDGEGIDIAFFVSGSKGGKDGKDRGVSLFGGDLVTSGTVISRGANGGAITGSITRTSDGKSYIAAGANITITSGSDGQILIAGAAGAAPEWTDGGGLTGPLYPAGNSGVQNVVIGGTGLASADILLGSAGSAEFNKQAGAGQEFVVSTVGRGSAIHVKSSDNTVDILSGSGVTGGDGADVAFFVSGSVSGKDGKDRGVAVFAGDLLTSGVLYIEGSRDYQGATSAAIVLNDTLHSRIVWNSESDSNTPDAQIWEQNGDLYLSASDEIELQSNTATSITGYGDVRYVAFSRTGGTQRKAMFNPSRNDVDFEIANSTNYYAFKVDAAENWISIDKLSSEPIPGVDVNFFVSGSTTGKDGAERSVSVFGGDLVTSGVLYVEGNRDYQGATSAAIVLNSALHSRIVWNSESDSNTPDAQIWEQGGSLYLSSSDNLWLEAKDAILFDGNGDKRFLSMDSVGSQWGSYFNIQNNDLDFRIGNTTHDRAFTVDAAEGTVNIDRKISDAIPGSDVNFFVSGSTKARGTSTRGVSVFGGDLIISGTLYADRQVIEVDEAVTGSLSVSGSLVVSQSATVNDTVTALLGFSGSLTRLTDARSYIAAGSNITVASSSNGQIVISSTAGGTMSSFGLVGDTGSAQSITNGNNLTIAGGTGLITTASATDTLTIDLDYNGTDNFIDAAPNLEGTSINASDSIVYHDHTDDNVKKGRVSDLPFASSDTTYTAGDGLDLSGTTFSTDLKNDGGLKIDSTELAIDNNIVATVSGTSFTGGVRISSTNNIAPPVLGLFVQGTISGSIHETHEGKSYLVAGTNVTIASSSNGQVTISSTAGGTVDGSGVANRVAYWSDSDTLTSDADLTFDGTDLGVGNKIFHVGDDNTFIYFNDDDINISVGGVNMVDFTENAGSQDEITFNEAGADLDFRVESDDNPHMFFINANDNRISIGTQGNTPETVVHIKDTSPEVRIQRALNGQDSTISFAGAAGVRGSMTGLQGGTNDIVFDTFNSTTLEEIARFGGLYTGGPSGRQVILLSGSTMHAGAMQPREASDIAFFVSGAISSRGSSTLGASVFGGDNVISGSLTVLNSGVGGGTISGSIHETEDGISYLIAGTNVSIVSASNGQVTISSTAGGSEWTDGGSFLYPTDNSGVEHVVIGGNSLVNADILLGSAGGAEFNKQRAAASDFTVSTQDDQYALVVDGGTNQVCIHDPGNATPGNYAGGEASFYVSGAIGLSGAGAGKAIFGGDAVISGTLHIKGNYNSSGPSSDETSLRLDHGIAFDDGDSWIYENGDDLWLVGKVDTNLSASDDIFIGSGDTTCLTTGGSFLAKSGGELTNGFFITGTDTWMHVSGAIGGHCTSGSAGIVKSTVAFGGDVVISGSMRAKQIENYRGSYNNGSNADPDYIPLGPSASESSVAGYLQHSVMPFAGRLVKLSWRPENAQQNAVTATVFKGVDGNATPGIGGESVTVAGKAGFNTHSFHFQQAVHFNEGDIFAIEVNPGSTPGTVTFTATFEMDMFI